MADINERLMNGAGLVELWRLASLKFGGAYKHWWKRKPYDNLVVEGDATTYATTKSASPVSKVTLYYSDSLLISGATASLANPQSVEFKRDDEATASVLVGKYFSTAAEGETIYRAPADAVVKHEMEGTGYNETTGLVTYTNWITISPVYPVTLVPAGDWAYVGSDQRDAYPDSGVADNVEYLYLGVPFENARDGVKVQTGSYVGTGTNKEAGAISITFDFVPAIVIIHCKTTTNYQAPFAIFTPVLLSEEYTGNGFVLLHDDFYGGSAKIVGTTMSWYTTAGASGFIGDAQMNTAGVTFEWLAIG